MNTDPKQLVEEYQDYLLHFYGLVEMAKEEPEAAGVALFDEQWVQDG